MYAIFTKYHGPTNALGSRVKATFGNARQGKKSITVEWNPEWSAEKNHDYVATKLAIQMKWHGEFYRGDLGADGMVYVRVTGSHHRAFAIGAAVADEGVYKLP